MTARQRKAVLPRRIDALQALVDDFLFQQDKIHHPWLKEELKEAKHCMKEEHWK